MARRVETGGPGRSPVAVIDIGSNSLRLVIYDGVRRAATMLFNEKVLCGLGRGLETTRHLNREGVALARLNLRRFVALARAVRVGRLDVLATAAVRDAEDGRSFVADIERQFAINVRVLGGEEEGRLSALGVMSSIPGAEGLVGDLGGGSVELVEVANGATGHAVSLPLGPLRLADLAEDEKRVNHAIDRQLAGVNWLGSKEGAFYAVGGAWRALARIHMEQTRYPLHIIQEYTLARSEALDFLDVIAHLSRKSLEKITTGSRKRLEVVPLAARLLARIARRTLPRQIIFSAFGLREGHLFSLLDADEARADPLIAASTDIACQHARFGLDADALMGWVAPLFPQEEPRRQRLRRAVTLLSDATWHEHPDYRAEQALRHALYLPVAGLGHAERAFLGAALHARYGGNDIQGLDVPRRLLSEEAFSASRITGLALRLAYTLTGGVPGLLAATRLVVEDGALVLAFKDEGALRFGESVQRRLDALGRARGQRTEVRGL
ncbi:MAG TPA: Ppx/GppA family phosphatase [Stellaceae bacterium]|nr:Ppx/GppA family phosphatase [Stellaceae bacterium]